VGAGAAAAEVAGAGFPAVTAEAGIAAAGKVAGIVWVVIVA